MSLEASELPRARAILKVEDGPALAPGRMTKWLDDNYSINVSKGPYVVALKNWIISIYGRDSVGNYEGLKYGKDKGILKRNKEKRIQEIEAGIEKYFRDLDKRDFLVDYKKFIHWMREEEYANLTIRSMCSKVKLFFGRQDPRCKIDDEDWSQIKRNLLPKSTRAATQDDILTKEELRRVLRYLSIHGRALALFLLSTGARIGASCKLKMRDLHLYEYPPRVNIREEYTKGQVGGRVMWFSYEARDAIQEWHEDRKSRKKAGGGTFLINPKAKEVNPEDLVFNYKPKVFNEHWNAGLMKADRGKKPAVLARRDPSTKKRIHVYHTHTLRKFFRTNMGFEGTWKGRSGVPDVIVHGWMGHKAYLEEAYARGNKRMAEIYKENMNVVTIYEVDLTRESVAMKDAYIEKLEAELARLKEAKIDMDSVKKYIDDRIKEINQKDNSSEE